MAACRFLPSLGTFCVSGILVMSSSFVVIVGSLWGESSLDRDVFRALAKGDRLVDALLKRRRILCSNVSDFFLLNKYWFLLLKGLSTSAASS